MLKPAAIALVGIYQNVLGIGLTTLFAKVQFPTAVQMAKLGSQRPIESRSRASSYRIPYEAVSFVTTFRECQLRL